MSMLGEDDAIQALDAQRKQQIEEDFAKLSEEEQSAMMLRFGNKEDWYTQHVINDLMETIMRFKPIED